MKNKNNNRKSMVAQIISSIFGAPWIAILIFTFITTSGLTEKQIHIFIVLYIIILSIPFLYIAWEKKKGYIQDYDLSILEERKKPLIIFLYSSILMLIMTCIFGTKSLFIKQLTITIVLFINTYITLYWKISLHMGVAITSIILLMYMYGASLSILLLSIPLLFWARYVLKKHTISQLLLGIIVSGGATILMYNILRLY